MTEKEIDKGPLFKRFSGRRVTKTSHSRDEGVLCSPLVHCSLPIYTCTVKSRIKLSGEAETDGKYEHGFSSYSLGLAFPHLLIISRSS